MKPRPCAQPNSIVSVSKPGTSQKKIRPVKIPNSIHESRLTQTNRGPGTGFLTASMELLTISRDGNPTTSVRVGVAVPGGQRGEDYALLLAGVSDGVTLAGAGASRAADVVELDAVWEEVGQAT